VQPRDEKAAAVAHTSMVSHPRGGHAGPPVGQASIAARIRLTDSSSGRTEVSNTTSARAGGSYGSLTPVNSGISPARALA
jgi:hypothetical protein